jgi:hypothetical protein
MQYRQRGLKCNRPRSTTGQWTHGLMEKRNPFFGQKNSWVLSPVLWSMHLRGVVARSSDFYVVISVYHQSEKMLLSSIEVDWSL